MKKVFFILSFLFTLFIVNAQTTVNSTAEKTATTVVDSTNYLALVQAEKLVDKYSGNITAAVVSLAKALQQPAEKVFQILTYKAFAEGLGLLLLPIITILLIIWFFLSFKKSEWTYSGDPDNKYAVMTIISGATSVIMLAVTYINITNMITHLIAPEYYAIKDIIDIVQTLKK